MMRLEHAVRSPEVSPLARHSVRASAVSVSVVLAIALTAGLVRLLPWLLAPELPWRVVAPFARALGAVAFETALMVGIPAGAALGAAELVQRGEARALFALGASPLAISRGLWLPLATAAAVCVAVTLAWQPSTDRPGLFAQALIEQAARGCDEKGARSVGVPIVGVTWLCFGGEGRQRLAGPVPKSGGRAWYTARKLNVSDDLRVFHAESVQVGTRPDPERAHLKLRVRRADIIGMPGWGRGAPLKVRYRALFVAVWIVLLGWCAALSVLHFAFGRAFAMVLGVAPALLALHQLHALPSGSGPLDAALGVLGVGIAVLASCLLVPGLVRFLRRFSGASAVSRPGPAEGSNHP
jgi:hypothetical protein